MKVEGGIIWGLEGVQPHFIPSPNPDFDVSWEKMGKKHMEREGKSICFTTLLAYYYHCFLHIKQDISCNILYDLVMTAANVLMFRQ